MDEEATAQIFTDNIREILDTPFYGPSTLAAIGRMMKGQDPGVYRPAGIALGRRSILRRRYVAFHAHRNGQPGQSGSRRIGGGPRGAAYPRKPRGAVRSVCLGCCGGLRHVR